MSFNRANYDTCATKQNLVESVRPGEYRMNPPTKCVESCYPSDPSIRLQKTGNSIDQSQYLVDIQSEMWGITRKASKCASERVQPCGTNQVMYGKECTDESLKHYKDCENGVEYTRLSNPSCTLRGTGWNRWEWLCQNPQERVARPFDWNIDTRLVAKDNHRPCVPKPLNQSLALPHNGLPDSLTLHPSCGNNTDTPSGNWSFCAQIGENTDV